VCTHPVHPVAGAPLNVEGHNLVVDLGFDEAVPKRNDGGKSLERQIRQRVPKLRMNRSLLDAGRMLGSSACPDAVSVVDERGSTLGFIGRETAKSGTLPRGALVFTLFQLIAILALHDGAPLVNIPCSFFKTQNYGLFHPSIDAIPLKHP